MRFHGVSLLCTVVLFTLFTLLLHFEILNVLRRVIAVEKPITNNVVMDLGVEPVWEMTLVGFQKLVQETVDDPFPLYLPLYTNPNELMAWQLRQELTDETRSTRNAEAGYEGIRNAYAQHEEANR